MEKELPEIKADKASKLPPVPGGAKNFQVIYHPDGSDPSETMVHGVRFRAGVAVPISSAQTALVPITDKVERDGIVCNRTVERRIPLVDLLRRNPFFSVDGERAERVRPGSQIPTSPDSYRGYAIIWIAASNSASGIRHRWAAEEALRMRCGCQAEDIAYISPFLEMRVKECEDGGGVLAA